MLKKRVIILLLTVFAVFWSCSNDSNPVTPGGEDEFGKLSLAFVVPPAVQQYVSRAEVVVSAAGMDTIRTALSVSDTSVTGVIEEIPAGQNRKFAVFVYDANELLTYQGEATADVLAGQTITVQLTLYPVNHTGRVIIIGTFADPPGTSGIVAYLSNEIGNSNIKIFDVAANVSFFVTSDPQMQAFDPRLSPDRSKITFNRFSNGYYRPFIVNRDGSGLSELPLIPGSDIAYCGWSPDGSEYLFHSDIDGDDEIYRYKINTEETMQVTFNNSIDWAPVWSPSGDKIAWQSNMSGIFRVHTMNADGSNVQLLTSDSFEQRNPEYSPDGNYIVFYGRMGGSWDLYMANSDGSNLSQLTNSPANEFRQCWSPDSKNILYVKASGSSIDLYIYNLASGNSEPFLASPTIFEDHPHWR